MVGFGLCTGSSLIAGGLGVDAVPFYCVQDCSLKKFVGGDETGTEGIPPQLKSKEFVFCYITSKLKEVLFCGPLHCIRC